MSVTQATIYQQFCVISPWEAPAILITTAIWMAQMVKDSGMCLPQAIQKLRGRTKVMPAQPDSGTKAEATSEQGNQGVPQVTVTPPASALHPKGLILNLPRMNPELDSLALPVSAILALCFHSCSGLGQYQWHWRELD